MHLKTIDRHENCSSTGLTNLWYASPKWHAVNFLCHAAFKAVSIIFNTVARPAYLYCEEYLYIYTYLMACRICMTYFCYQIIRKMKHFYTVRSVYCIWIIGSPVWPSLGEYVIRDTTLYNPRHKPLNQVFKWRPHWQLLRSTKSIAVRIILLTLCLDCFVSRQ
jgi:hypothetical protein